MDGWGTVALRVVALAISVAVYRAYCREVDLSAARWLRIRELEDRERRLVDALDGEEPTRPDANDPLRSRFVFCGRWPEHGHASACPWAAIAADRSH